MKIKALRRFEDYKEDVIREVGDEFEVTEERFEEIKVGLTKFGEGDWVEEVVEPKTAPAKKTTTTKGKA